MAASILVAYSSKYGSTAEVAEAVGARLRERGLAAEVKRVDEVRSLDGCTAVVLGSPLYIGSVRKDAAAFLERHRAALEAMPVAVFAPGPLSANGLEASRNELAASLEKNAPWLKPVASEVFVGAYDPAKLKFADKLIAVMPASPLHDVPAKDERDWPAIEAWADTLPSLLQPRA